MSRKIYEVRVLVTQENAACDLMFDIAVRKKMWGDRIWTPTMRLIDAPEPFYFKDELEP